MNDIYKIATTSLLAAALAACGGGSSGGGSSGGGSEIPTPETQPESKPETDITAASSLQVVYGKISDADFKPLVNVNVNLILQSQEQATLASFSAQTDSSGNYQLQIPEFTGEQVARLVLNISKDGFTSSEKVVDIDETHIAMSVDGTLSKVASVSIKRADLDQIAFSADGEPKIQLTLVKNSQGQRKILLGDAQAAEGEETELGLSLPSSALPEEIEVINGEIAYFDSSNSSDIESFPGEFIGVGETELQGQGVSFNRDDDDAEEYRLISSTFSQVKLSDQNGDALKLSDVQAADGSNPVMTMRVPQGSYPTIKKDFDLSLDGIQIPIYVYKWGEDWQYVGNGLLVDAAGNAVGPSYPESAPVGVAEDGSLSLSAYSQSLFVQVEIVEANQWLSWINLDWPIKVADEVTRLCFNGAVTYKGGEAFTGSVSVRLPDGGFEWVNVSEGQFNLTSSMNSGAELVSSADNWQFSLRNAKTGQIESISLPDPLITGETCNELSIELINPYQCQVIGNLFASDGVTKLSHQVVSTSVNGNQNFYTSSDGTYKMSVACDTEFTVKALDQEQLLSITAAEVSKQVDFVKANQKPILGLSTDGVTQLNVDEVLSLKWVTSDPDGDAVAVSVQSCAAGELQCIVEAADSGASISFTTAGSYLIVVQADDGTHQVQRELSIEVQPIGNKAPKIIGFELDGVFYDIGSQLDLVVQQNTQLSVVASDVNADPLSYQWEGISCESAQCTYAPTEEGDFTLRVVVNDNNPTTPLSAAAQLHFKVTPDLAPTATLVLSASAVSESAGMNAEAISILLQAADDRTPLEQLALTWSLFSGEQDYSTALSFAEGERFSALIAAGVLPIGEYQLSAVLTDTNVNGELGQSTTVTESILVTDDLPPSITLLASATALTATAQGSEQAVTVSATVADDKGAEHLQLAWSVSPEINFTVSDSGLELTLAAADLVVGNYAVTATVTDANQQSASANSAIAVTQDMPPVISSLTVTPVNQAETTALTNPFAVNALLASSDDFTSEPEVEWQIIPAVDFTASNSELTIAEGSISSGSYELIATVTDHRGQATSKSVTFNVSKREGNVDIVID